MQEREKRKPAFRHGILALGLLAFVMFGCVVGLGTEPQIPLVAGCAISGCIALYLGFSWNDVLDGMVKGITDSLEAVLILMAIGMLIGVWIQSGTVPTMIYYGLQAVSPELFLPATFAITTVVGLVIGSWGAAGTIGIAFLGIAAALDISPAMTAGAIVAGAYVSEIISPLVDGPNLAAAIARCNIFVLCRRFLPLCLAVCAGGTAVYAFIGMQAGGAADAETTAESVSTLLESLDSAYHIGPLTLIPLGVMAVCVFLKIPALPSFLLAIVVGMVEAVFLQGCSPASVVEAANTGAVSSTGFENLDALLSAGGIQEMMSTVSIVILVMAYSGIMQHTGLMESLVDPIVSKLKSLARLVSATVCSGALFNILLPDQYPAITLSMQMYRGEFERRGVKSDVWANIVNSSAGITSVLVPWNTCAVYMTTILGVSCVAYAPYAFFCYLYPIAVIAVGILLGKKIGWIPRENEQNPAGTD